MAEPACEETLEVTIERVVFRADDGPFTVVSVVREGSSRPMTVIGDFAIIPKAGELFAVTGSRERHPKFGLRFRVTGCVPRTPATESALRRYLGSGRIAGIGEKLAERIIKHFGLATLEVLETQPERVLEIRGVGRRKAEEIKNAFAGDRAQREALVFLGSLGLGSLLSRELWSRHGVAAESEIRADPYALARDVAGIGFGTADRIARSLGVEGDAPSRREAGVDAALRELVDQGNVGILDQEVLERARRLLALDVALLRATLSDMITRGALVALKRRDNGPEFRVYFPPLEALEREAAERLLARARDEAPAPVIDPINLGPDGLVLTPAQETAVRLLLNHRVALLTGGPGVGKTTVLRVFVRSCETVGIRVALASPTGRAAKRLSEATGSDARTLHRLLGITPGKVGSTAATLLDAGALIIDEASMLDLPLLVQVLRRLAPETRLVLVGDPDQLPSVGPGSILKDLIDSGAFPVARLEAVFRQAAGSLIVTNAHRILRGELPEEERDRRGGDFFFVERDDPAAGAALVLRLFLERIPASYGIDPREGIQVLTPMHRGITGTESLNGQLQEALNSGRPRFHHRDRVFFEGDRVMAVRNDYDLGLMNGELGVVTAIWPGGGGLDAVFDGRSVPFRGGDLRLLAGAFAMTVHKSQGGEFPAVILPIYPEHSIMLKRNILYTAVTRARRLLVLVGSRSALERAVRDDRHTVRGGELRARLAGEFLERRPVLD